MTSLEKQVRGRPAALDLVGDHGRETPFRIKAVDQHRVHLVQIPRRTNRMMDPGGVCNPLDLPLQHERAGPTLHAGITIGVHHQKNLPVAPGLILGSLNDLPGKGGGGDPVADETNQVRLTSRQTSGHGILPVPQLLGNLAHLASGGFRYSDVLVVIDRPRCRRNRNTCRPRDILKCDHTRQS